MGRRSSKEARYDRMDQYEKRKYKRKNSPLGREEKDWTEFLMKMIKRGASS
ncbi:hypothetical protein ACT8ZR_15795 [Neobacillus sp. M.A.Huq-85]